MGFMQVENKQKNNKHIEIGRTRPVVFIGDERKKRLTYKQ